jgi:hypothetical protein
LSNVSENADIAMKQTARIARSSLKKVSGCFSDDIIVNHFPGVIVHYHNIISDVARVLFRGPGAHT